MTKAERSEAKARSVTETTPSTKHVFLVLNLYVLLSIRIQSARMETTQALLEKVKSNILVSGIVIVLVLIIMFLLYRSSPPAVGKKETMTSDERELNRLIKQLEERQSNDGPAAD